MKRLLSLALFAALAACATTQPIPTSASSGGSSEVVIDQTTYRIGPGDMLDIFVWRNPEISTKVPVRPDGKISTPLVEDMVAVGKTPSELARDMEAVLAKYIKSPSVNVIVTDFQGPQAIPYREGMTVLDVMIAVGGLGEFAAGNKAKLVRKIDGTSTEYRLRLSDLLNNGDISQNADIRPGDVIIIPETFF